MKNPCHKCAERAQGCHSKCEAYTTWRAELDEANAALRRRYNADSDGVLTEWARRSRRNRERLKRK